MTGWREMLDELRRDGGTAAEVPAVDSPMDSARERWRARTAELQRNHHVAEEWARALAAVETMPMPDEASPERWAQIVADATAFVTRWHEHLSGWSITDAFGLDPDGGPEHRGFVLRIRGDDVLILDDGEAVIRRPHGERANFRPGSVPADTPPLWKLETRQ